MIQEVSGCGGESNFSFQGHLGLAKSKLIWKHRLTGYKVCHMFSILFLWKLLKQLVSFVLWFYQGNTRIEMNMEKPINKNVSSFIKVKSPHTKESALLQSLNQWQFSTCSFSKFFGIWNFWHRNFMLCIVKHKHNCEKHESFKVRTWGSKSSGESQWYDVFTSVLCSLKKL